MIRTSADPYYRGIATTGQKAGSDVSGEVSQRRRFDGERRRQDPRVEAKISSIQTREAPNGLMRWQGSWTTRAVSQGRKRPCACAWSDTLRERGTKRANLLEAVVAPTPSMFRTE